MAVVKETDYVEEPGKKVPVLHDVDVVIAGGGIAGVFAAVAAARKGASVALVDRFGIPATTRISLGLYNTREEIDAAVAAIRRVKEVFHC